MRRNHQHQPPQQPAGALPVAYGGGSYAVPHLQADNDRLRHQNAQLAEMLAQTVSGLQQLHTEHDVSANV